MFRITIYLNFIVLYIQLLSATVFTTSSELFGVLSATNFKDPCIQGHRLSLLLGGRQFFGSTSRWDSE